MARRRARASIIAPVYICPLLSLSQKKTCILRSVLCARANPLTQGLWYACYVIGFDVQEWRHQVRYCQDGVEEALDLLEDEWRPAPLPQSTIEVYWEDEFEDAWVDEPNPGDDHGSDSNGEVDYPDEADDDSDDDERWGRY